MVLNLVGSTWAKWRNNIIAVTIKHTIWCIPHSIHKSSPMSNARFIYPINRLFKRKKNRKKQATISTTVSARTVHVKCTHIFIATTMTRALKQRTQSRPHRASKRTTWHSCRFATSQSTCWSRIFIFCPNRVHAFDCFHAVRAESDTLKFRHELCSTRPARPLTDVEHITRITVIVIVRCVSVYISGY